jgi:class 3 adenylate cyclase
MEGERKGVTVMFSDVSGFTAMSEKLDPEDVHAIMDRAFEVILREVHRYEGTINQFLGDGVMALFGAPVAHEDHTHRALSAALAIQSGLGPLADEVRRTHGIEFRMRMGINTGLVVVGAIGKDLRMDYTAVGDATNLAARLLGIAKPGQIVVSRRTQHLREGFFVFDDLGDFEVKGKSEPVRAYAVKSEISGRTRLEVSRERGLTPLVGRDQELASLARVHQRAADAERRVHLVDQRIELRRGVVAVDDQLVILHPSDHVHIEHSDRFIERDQRILHIAGTAEQTAQDAPAGGMRRPP